GVPPPEQGSRDKAGVLVEGASMPPSPASDKGKCTKKAGVRNAANTASLRTPSLHTHHRGILLRDVVSRFPTSSSKRGYQITFDVFSNRCLETGFCIGSRSFRAAAVTALRVTRNGVAARLNVGEHRSVRSRGSAQVQ